MTKKKKVTLSPEERANYKDYVYYSLPENARKAMDKVMMKKRHTDFYCQLEKLNT